MKTQKAAMPTLLSPLWGGGVLLISFFTALVAALNPIVQKHAHVLNTFPFLCSLIQFIHGFILELSFSFLCFSHYYYY